MLLKGYIFRDEHGLNPLVDFDHEFDFHVGGRGTNWIEFGRPLNGHYLHKFKLRLDDHGSVWLDNDDAEDSWCEIGITAESLSAYALDANATYLQVKTTIIEPFKEMMTQYFTNDVYGFHFEYEEDGVEETDSSGGFFGGIEGMEESLEAEIPNAKELLEEMFEKIDNQFWILTEGNKNLPNFLMGVNDCLVWNGNEWVFYNTYAEYCKS